MSDTTYETFQHYGTNADRLAFTPNPSAGIQPIYIWYETDTNNVYVYTTAWHLVSGSSSGSGGSASLNGPIEIDFDEDDIGEGFPIPGPPGPTGSSGGGTLTGNETFLTENDETGTAPNSRQVLPGTNISFDDTTPGERTINASGSAPAFTTVFKTSDQSKASDNTRAADPVLLVTMLANTKYSIRGMLFVTAGAGGFFGKFSGPSSPTVLATMRWVIDGTGSSFTNIKHDSAYAQDFSTGTDCMMRFEVLIHNGANAGDFTIDWAQGTVDVTNTTMRAGSYIEYHQL